MKNFLRGGIDMAVGQSDKVTQLQSDKDLSSRLIERNNSRLLRLRLLADCRNDGGIVRHAAYSLWPKAITIIFCVLFSGLLISPAQGQEAKGLKKTNALQIGDTIPDEVWNLSLEVVNNKSGRLKRQLSELKGKYIILDFLSIGCASCIKALPRFKGCENLFDSDLHFVPVTSEDRNRVQKFWENNTYAESADMSIVVQDKTLKNYFPHSYISHLVWIDKQGKVCAFTGASFVEPRTIKLFMEGRHMDWPIKTETTAFFSKPFLQFNFLEGDEYLRNYNLLKDWVWLSGYVAGVGPLADSVAGLPSGYQWLSFRNRQAIDLLRIALNIMPSIPVIYEGLEPERFAMAMRDPKRMNIDEWIVKYAINYERALPIGISDSVWKEKLLTDICRYLQVNVELTMQSGNTVLLVKSIIK